MTSKKYKKGHVYKFEEYRMFSGKYVKTIAVFDGSELIQLEPEDGRGDLCVPGSEVKELGEAGCHRFISDHSITVWRGNLYMGCTKYRTARAEMLMKEIGEALGWEFS